MSPHVMLLCLLGGATPAASLSPPEPVPLRHVVVDGEGPPTVHRLFVAPGLSTTFLVDAPLEAGGVVLEEVKLFQRVEALGQGVVLVPGVGLKGHEPLRLVLRYADAGWPREAHFLLVVDETRAERQVEVHRRVLPAEVLASQLREAKERLAQAENQLKHLGAGTAPGLSTALLNKHLDRLGVTARELPRPFALEATVPLRVMEATTFRTVERVVVLLQVKGDALTQPWEATRATLVTPGGTEVPAAFVGQTTPLLAEAPALVAVEFEETVAMQGLGTLRIWGRGMETPLTVERITFPPPP